MDGWREVGGEMPPPPVSVTSSSNLLRREAAAASPLTNVLKRFSWGGNSSSSPSSCAAAAGRMRGVCALRAARTVAGSADTCSGSSPVPLRFVIQQNSLVHGLKLQESCFFLFCPPQMVKVPRRALRSISSRYRLRRSLRLLASRRSAGGGAL